MKALLVAFVLSIISVHALAANRADCTVFENAGDGYSWSNVASADQENPAKIYGLKILLTLSATPNGAFLMRVAGPRGIDSIFVSANREGVLRRNRLKFACVAR